MSENTRRRWTPQEKLRIVEEARKDGAPVSQVCRRHGIAPTLFYEWERKIKDGALTGLKAQRPQKPGPKPEELQAEIVRLKGIIAEIAEENLRIKKGLWP